MAQGIPSPSDPNLSALRLLLAVHGVRVGEEGLRGDLARTGRSSGDVAALAKILAARGLRPVCSKVRWNRLAGQPLPALAEMKGGGVLLVAKAGADEVLIQDSVLRRPETLTRDVFEGRWTGRLLSAAPDGRAEGDGRFGFGWFLPMLRKHRMVLGQALVASLLLQIFALALPLFVMIVMDKVIANAGLTTLDVLTLGVLVMVLFEFVLSALRAHLLSYATHRVGVELSAHMFRHLLSLPMSYFDSRSTGGTASRLRELDTIRSFMTGPALTSGIDLAFTAVHLSVMCFFSPVFAIAVLLAVTAMIALHVLVTPALRRRLSGKLRGEGDGQAFLIEAVTGVETIKASATEGAMQWHWEERVAERAEAAFRADQLSQNTNAAILLVNRLIAVLMLWYGVHMVVDGQISVGQLMAFNMMCGRVMGPAQRLAQMWSQLQQAKLAVRRVAEVLDAAPEPAQAPVGVPPPTGRVEFRDVTFRYRPGRPAVLRKVSLEIRPGEMVGVVGTSGSGKSTLARLVQRLYVPESGRILVDGVDIASIDPVWLRRRVALVPQDTFLFDRSVRDNIAFIDPDLPLDRVIAAATLAGAHEFITELPEGYDTKVGERGHLLSGGQRQRVALARALAADPRVLILDEATSALDSESERLVQANMRRICAGRTVIAIAHRLSTLSDTDRVLVVEGGEIVEQGSPAELLARGGRFADLWRCQMETHAFTREVEHAVV